MDENATFFSLVTVFKQNFDSNSEINKLTADIIYDGYIITEKLNISHQAREKLDHFRGHLCTEYDMFDESVGSIRRMLNNTIVREFVNSYSYLKYKKYL